MKKSFLALAVVLGASTTFAQDLTSKKGENYLPEAGDWAIGIDAVPVLNYIGNFFGKGNDNLHANNIWNFNNPNAVITGKYFVEEGMAYRAGIRLGFGSAKSSEMVADRASTAVVQFPSTVPAEVENTMKVGGTNIGLTVGIEKRKGNTRLQGFYGADLGIMIKSSKSTFEYGNALTQPTSGLNVNVDPADAMGAGTNLSTDVFGNGSRILTDKSGLSFGVGVRAFIGAEYFVLPKLSLGGEFGWGLVFQANGTRKVEMESEGINASAAEELSTSTVETKNGSSFGVDTQNVNAMFGPAGRLNLTFHF